MIINRTFDQITTEEIMKKKNYEYLVNQSIVIVLIWMPFDS